MARKSKKPLEHPPWFTSVTWVITVGPFTAVPNIGPASDGEIDPSTEEQAGSPSLDAEDEIFEEPPDEGRRSA